MSVVRSNCSHHLMEKFIICLKRSGLYQFKLINESEQTMLTSLSYPVKQTCLDDLELLRSAIDFDSCCFISPTHNGNFCFSLLKNELEVLAISKGFENETDCVTYLQQLQHTVKVIRIDSRLH